MVDSDGSVDVLFVLDSLKCPKLPYPQHQILDTLFSEFAKKFFFQINPV